MRFGYCLGSGNGTRSLRTGDFFFAGSSRGGGRCTKRFRRRNKWSKRGKTALVYLRNKQVSKNCVYRSVFQPVSFFFLIFFNFFSPNWFFFNQLSHIFPVEEVWSRAERRKCWFCDCGNRGKNIEGIWDSRSCYKFQNSQRLQEKDFSPPFSVQESVKKWGEKYKEAYWCVEGKKPLLQNFLSWAWKQLIDWGKPTASWAEKESWTGFSRRAGKEIKNWAGVWRCY